VLDLIDAKNKDLAWRLYVAEKIINVDKDWKKADADFTKGFEGFPPSAKEIEEKKKERANEKPKPEREPSGEVIPRLGDSGDGDANPRWISLGF
jgi:hypothetical protein